MTQDKNRLRKTYSFFRQQPVPVVYASGGGGAGCCDKQFWESTTLNSIYTTGSVVIPGQLVSVDSPYDLGSDTFFYVSGSIGSTSHKKISVFGGDLLSSGSTTALMGLSGSLTKLFDGTSYLIGGNGITISSSSNGPVTISSIVAGPAGADGEIQFNNAGSFGASNNFSFNSTSNTLSLTGSMGMKGNIIPDVDTTYNLGSTNKRWANVYTGDLHLRNDRGDWTIVEEKDYLCVVNNITGKKYKMMLEPLDKD